jgi:hypothetical protein
MVTADVVHLLVKLHASICGSYRLSPFSWQSSSFARPRPLSTTAPHVREHIDSPTIMDGAPLCPRSHVPHAALSAFLIPLTRAPRSCTVTAASATAIEAPWTCRYLISGCKVSALPGPPCPAMPSTFVHVLQQSPLLRPHIVPFRTCLSSRRTQPPTTMRPMRTWTSASCASAAAAMTPPPPTLRPTPPSTTAHAITVAPGAPTRPPQTSTAHTA